MTYSHAKLICVFLLANLLPSIAMSNQIRIKDLVEFDGVRGNDLIGYGLVVGLNGTGDGLRNAPFTEEIMSNILERLGVNVTGEQFRPKNVAAVFVTSELPPFARAGGRIDVTVSAIGDAKSLLGGTLIMTPLNAADGDIYAVAQGTVIAGGVSAEGEAGGVIQGVPTSGVIPAGARIEREIDFDFRTLSSLRLALREPDFTTAGRIERAINKEFGKRVALMLDSGTVQLDVVATSMRSPAHALGRIENISVRPERKARVVVDQRSGTIVHGRGCAHLTCRGFTGQPDPAYSRSPPCRAAKPVFRWRNCRSAQNQCTNHRRGGHWPCRSSRRHIAK